MKKLFISALCLLSSSAFADESSIHLKDGPGREMVAGTCSICHSTDMILINSPFMNRKEWEGVVNKMVHVMGAPLAEEDIPLVVEYLSRNYGM